MMSTRFNEEHAIVVEIEAGDGEEMLFTERP